MAIVWARIKPGKGTGIDDGGQQTFRTSYTVKSDTPTESRSAILSCGLIPVYGAPHPDNLQAVCIRVSVDQNKENPYLWDATAEWRVNPASKRDPADQQKQPDQRREKWSLRTVPLPLSIYADLDGKPLCSSAGQPFDPVIQVPIICDEITVQRYQTTCHRGTQRSWVDKTNLNAWFGCPQGTALVQGIVAYDEYIQGAFWWNTTYTILYKPRVQITLPKGSVVYAGGWNPEYIADLGTLQWATVNGQTRLVPITRVDPTTGKPFYDGRPAYLDGFGRELPRDANGIYLSDPVIRPFKLKNSFNFYDMNLSYPPGLDAF